MPCSLKIWLPGPIFSGGSVESVSSNVDINIRGFFKRQPRGQEKSEALIASNPESSLNFKPISRVLQIYERVCQSINQFDYFVGKKILHLNMSNRPWKLGQKSSNTIKNQYRYTTPYIRYPSIPPASIFRPEAMLGSEEAEEVTPHPEYPLVIENHRKWMKVAHRIS